MERLIEQVRQLVDEEYGRASEKFGKVNNSDHESYSVLLEEFEEAEDDLSFCRSALSSFWQLVKDKCAQDADKLICLNTIQSCALMAACEFIQVSAMAHKAAVTITKGETE